MSQNPRTGGRGEIVDKVRREFPDIDEARAQRIVTVVVDHMKESVRIIGTEMKQRTAQEVSLAIGLSPVDVR